MAAVSLLSCLDFSMLAESPPGTETGSVGGRVAVPPESWELSRRPLGRLNIDDKVP